LPNSSQQVTVTADVKSESGAIQSAIIKYGNSSHLLNQTITMTAIGNKYSGIIPSMASGKKVYYRIVAQDGTNFDSISYDYHVVDLSTVHTGYSTKTINEIQGLQSLSPLSNQKVIVTGVVSARIEDGFFIQTDSMDWNGLYVFYPYDEAGFDIKKYPPRGAKVTVAGKVTEFFDMTELKEITGVYVNEYAGLSKPIKITTGSLSEKHESMLVTVTNATCKTVSDGYGVWTVNDGSGVCNIHDNYTGFSPQINKNYTITGAVTYSYGKYRIELTDIKDVEAGNSVNETSQNNDYSLSPNPVVNSNFTISANEIILKSELYYSTGMLATKVECYSKECLMNVSNLKTGIYILLIYTKTKTMTDKIIINN